MHLKHILKHEIKYILYFLTQLGEKKDNANIQEKIIQTLPRIFFFGTRSFWVWWGCFFRTSFVYDIINLEMIDNMGGFCSLEITRETFLLKKESNFLKINLDHRQH